MAKMNERQHEIMRKGSVANSNWVNYYKEFYEGARNNLQKQFERLEPDNVTEMVAINCKLRALKELKDDLHSDMAQGKAVSDIIEKAVKVGSV